MILPTKFENERIMFTLDYGDMLPWGSVVELAKITVEVSSGDDPVPQRVFSQTWDIDGTIVTYQVRRGVPGVIYRLLTAVLVAGNWVEREIKLAILPDHGDVGSLYPLTRIFTSLPYVQLMEDAADMQLSVNSGMLVTLLFDSSVQPLVAGLLLVPDDGALFESGLHYIKDITELGLLPTDGILKVPPLGEFLDEVVPSLSIVHGALKPPPIGNLQNDENDISLIPTGGSLHYPFSGYVLVSEDGKIMVDESGNALTME